MQAVVITLDPEEVVIAKAGAMMYKNAAIDMATSMSTRGDDSFFGNLLGAGKRMITGESFFITQFANLGRERADVAFSGPYPDQIIPIDLAQFGGGDPLPEGCLPPFNRGLTGVGPA